MGLTTAAVIILSLWVVAIVIAGLVMILRPGGVGVRFAQASGTPADAVSERQEIPLGGEAQVLGNVRGRVVAVLLNPATRGVEAIQLGGLLEAETVPVDAIVDADGQTVTLTDGWPETNHDIEGKLAVLRGNMAVVGANGKRLGRLRAVCFDQASTVATALVVGGAGQASERLVPMARITEAAPDRIITNLPAAENTNLQPYATDWDIRQAIAARLATADLHRAIQVGVQDQRVRLQGYVDDRSETQRVEQAVRAVPGVLELDSHLMTDDELAQAVNDAISKDSVASAATVQVTAQSGVVDITGVAPDRPTVRRIDAVTQGIDGAQVVHNMVVVQAATVRAAS
jgi:osmotically-inducible protein OsmY